MGLIDTLATLRHSAKRRLSALFASVDRRSSVDPWAMLNRFTRIRNSTIGRFTYIGPRTTLDNVDVGSFCSISWDCCIGLASHPSNLISTSPIFYEKYNGTGTSWLARDAITPPVRRTTIGSDVWIGARSLIMEGVEIGHGAIVAAGSVVTKNVRPYAIVGGVPAREIKLRFAEDVIHCLLEGKWWNLSEEELRARIAEFSIPDPDEITVSRISISIHNFQGL